MGALSVSIPLGGNARQQRDLVAVADGCRNHGLQVTLTSAHVRDMKEADIGVLWGGPANQPMQWDFYTSRGIPILVAEAGNLGDRDQWTALGWNGIAGRAEYCVDGEVSGDRWERYWSHQMKAWRQQSGDGYVLLMGQVPGDQSIGQFNLSVWYTEIAAQLCGMVVMFRPHPLRPQTETPPLTMRLDGSLDDALAGASHVVTYCSLSGVASIMAGVPTMAQSHVSMAYPVAAHSLDELFAVSPEPDRNSWGARLAYTQWTIDEISNGEAWNHLKQLVETWH